MTGIREYFGNIADAIIRQLKPTSVLDAGCALGFLVEALRFLRDLCTVNELREFVDCVQKGGRPRVDGNLDAA